MRYIHLTFLYYMLTVLTTDQASSDMSERGLRLGTPRSQTAGLTNETTDAVVPGVSNIILQSTDGGQTWQDISEGLPDFEQPKDFFAGESEIYLRVSSGMYRSKSNLKTPVWIKANVEPKSACIVFNPSGVTAYNFDGQIYQQALSAETWLPVHTNFRKKSMRTIFETSDGTVFVGSDLGLYKSSDKGKSWKQVQNEGWVMNIVEAEGVLIGTGQKGIMRSTDNGEHWEWVISEGGVGIAIERIDGGFAAISCSTSTISRRIYTSLDKGKTWKAIDEGLRPTLNISSIKQMGKYLICGHPDGIFRSADLGKTWNLVHATVDRKVVKYGNTWSITDSSSDGKVFRIYSSRNVLYAVIRDQGC